MAKLSKCKVCDNDILTDYEKIKVKNKNYHKECYDKYLYEKEQYKLLVSKICEIFNIDVPTGLILKQIKQYKEEFNYTYSGMHYTLWYMTEIEGKLFTEIKYGIALIKYYYEKAKQYYIQQEKIQNSILNKGHEEAKVKEIKINLDKVYYKQNNYLLNINDLLGGE